MLIAQHSIQITFFHAFQSFQKCFQTVFPQKTLESKLLYLCKSKPRFQRGRMSSLQALQKLINQVLIPWHDPVKIQSLTQLRILCIIHSTPEYLQHKEKTKRCLLQVAGAVADPKQFLKKNIFKSTIGSILFLGTWKRQHTRVFTK